MNAFPLLAAVRLLARLPASAAPEEYFAIRVDAVEIQGGTVNWNAYRQKWIMIGVQLGGKSSHLGEVWFWEADSAFGPWRWAKKIVTHERYSFYNPIHHRFFDQDNGRLIYFEGTYATTISGNEEPTPRYDYNQIMYRLDLADPRLKVPAGRKPPLRAVRD